MGNTAVVEEADNPSLQNYNGLPEPFTEVRFKKDALKDPNVQRLGGQTQEKIKQYIAESDSKDRKYRLIVSACHAIRNTLDLAGAGSLGYIVDIVEQEGPVSKGHFTVPLEVLEIKNAGWNAMQAPIPDGWRYDRFKHKKTFEVISSAYNDGKQPEGTIKKDKGK